MAVMFKVVQKETRYGSNWAMFEEALKSRPLVYEEGVKFRDENPALFPQYFKNSKLTALHTTLGFMVFESRARADRFIETNFLFCEAVRVIRVMPLDEPIARSEGQTRIVHGCGFDIHHLKWAEYAAEYAQKEEYNDPNILFNDVCIGNIMDTLFTTYRLLVLE